MTSYWVGVGNKTWSTNTWSSSSGGGSSPANTPTSTTLAVLDRNSGNCALDASSDTCYSVQLGTASNNLYSGTLVLGSYTLTITGTSGVVWDTSHFSGIITTSGSTLVLSGNAGTITFNGGGLTYGNLTITGNGTTATFTGTNTFTTFTSGANALVFSNTQTASSFNLTSCTALTGNLVQSSGVVYLPAGCVVTNSSASGGATFIAAPGVINATPLTNTGWIFTQTAIVLDTLQFVNPVLDILQFPTVPNVMNSSLITTGSQVFPIGQLVTFQAATYLNGVFWNLTGGSATLLLADSAGNTYSVSGSVNGPSASATFTIPNVPGKMVRSWQLTDGNGIMELSLPIAFTVVASPGTPF